MNRNRKYQPRQAKTSQRKGTREFNNALDRTRVLGDGSVAATQDRFERRTLPGPPTTIPADISRQGYWYRGSTALANFASSAVAPVSAAYFFTLAQLSLASSLAAVFDQYCIVEVTVRFAPSLTQNTTTAIMPIFQSVIDHDDANTLTAAGASEYASVLETLGNVGHTRVVRPRIDGAVYSGAFTSFDNIRAYVDCASPNVQHYGVKIVLSAAPTVITYVVMCEYVLHFRDTH